ncbi:MAG: Ldh family oxidoreductase [Planctomycetes bacterium]|nr:Ldh family oxidoreductase [Planctomycetota bacterium]
MLTLSKFDQSHDERFPAESLREFAFGLFSRAGISDVHARLVADSLIDANLRGVDTHGVTRLLGKYVERLRDGRVNPRPDLRVLAETPATAVVDGDNGLGAVVADFAVRLALGKARQAGSAWVGVRHSTHFGACGYWTRQMAEAGMMGIGMTNGPSAMAPWGGVAPYQSTNPISFAVPTGKGWPLVLDMATCVAARGNFILAKAMGQPLPQGWAFDDRGEPTTDPDVALRGTVVPIAGHKGYGLSLFIDVLCGILAGAAFGPHIGHMYGNDPRDQNLGHVFAAVEIAAMADPGEFRRRMDQMIDEIHAVERKKGVDRIFVPGEIEMETAARRVREGIPLPAAVVQEFQKLSQELQVPFPRPGSAGPA